MQRFSRRELRAGITAGRAFNGVLTEITTSLIGIVSRTALLAGSAALGAFFVDGVRGALKFDEALTQVQALTNASREDIELYRDSVRQVASDVGRSSTDLAEGLFVINSAGVLGAEALDLLEAAGKGASAGLGETADLARAGAAAVFNFGESLESPAEAIDIITATAREGNFAVSELSGTIRS